MKPAHELAQVIQRYGADFVRTHNPLGYHQKVLRAISICRTSVLGGHVERCDNHECRHERVAYNSCRNRHCTKCQHAEREKWIAARMEDLLDCTYFHLVFTIPEELNTYCLHFPRQLYHILFQAGKDTLFTFGHDPKHLGAQMGAVAILHTWGQNLSLHPHVHMIVPGGGFTKQNRWKDCASSGNFLFPLRPMATVFRAKFMEMFLGFARQAEIQVPKELRRSLYAKNWVVHAKQPFKNPAAVVEYLGRYTHKVAISNHRIRTIENGKVSFAYKDYAHGGVSKIMTLDAAEFLRRFCMHILPPGFVKIRHYGFFSRRGKEQLRIYQMTQGILHIPTVRVEKHGDPLHFQESYDHTCCPCYRKGVMQTVLYFEANAPPPAINNKIKTDTTH